jgi:hypothetical protein
MVMREEMKEINLEDNNLEVLEQQDKIFIKCIKPMIILNNHWLY